MQIKPEFAPCSGWGCCNKYQYNKDSFRFRNNVGSKLYPLNEQQGEALRNYFSEVRLTIIDEIPMVSSVLFYQVNQRFNKVFGHSGNEPWWRSFSVTTSKRPTSL